MFKIRQTWQVLNNLLHNLKKHQKLNDISIRRGSKFQAIRFYCTENNSTKEVSIKGAFEDVEKKNKNTYLELINIFARKDKQRRGHVEFIYSALKNMEQFGVQKDLEVYKALIDVLPKGKFIPTNLFQSEFMHYPKQQQCAIDLLQQMEDNGVMPDYEMEDMLLNVFGKRGYPLRKFWRMMYWMPKFKNLSPWPVPNPPPSDSFELAKLAIERIASADVTSKIDIYQTANVEDSIDKTWIISSQSVTQRRLLKDHDLNEPIYIEGAFKIWLRDKSVDYFVLKANPKVMEIENIDSDDVSNISFSLFNMMPPQPSKIMKLPSVHEQDDGIILAVCATGTSSKDTLLSWIRLMEKDDNANLSKIPIVFKLRSSPKDISVKNDTKQDEKIPPK